MEATFRRGRRILASNGANLLRKVRFPEAAEDETESAPQISNEEDQELDAALDGDGDDVGPETDAVEQDLLESFMEDFLRVSPDEELSHEQAFGSFRGDWQEGVSIFNNALKALYKNVKQNIMALNEDDQDEFKSKAREYQAKLKSAMFSDADPINSVLSELEQDARQVNHLKEALKLARANTKHITDNDTVKHLRACPTMSIRGDVKRCLLIMEKTVVQIQAIRAEL